MENVKNNAAKAAAILDLISGISYVVFAIFFFIGINTFHSADSSDSQVGLIFVLVLLLPFAFITVPPSGIIGGIWQICRSTIYFTQINSGKKSGTGIIVLNIIIKILVAILAVLGEILFLATSDILEPIVLYVEAIACGVAIILSLIAIPFEIKAKI